MKVKKTRKDRHMFSWMSPKLEVKLVKNLGRGVYAREKVKKGEILAIFGGYILTLNQEAELGSENDDTGLQISDNFVITSKDHKEKTDYFNHSCDPNAGFSDQIILSSMREIPVGSEITFDYAMNLFSEKKSEVYSLECRCGAQNCRKLITSNDWKIIDLQNKYFGYFQPYIQRKIDKLNAK